MAVLAMVFSCSKDNVETETTADLTQSTTEITSAQEFSGVFGHHSIKDLHGKTYVTIDGSSSQATIELVNGEIMNFQGNQLGKEATTIYFSGNRGSFTFDASAEMGARVSDLIIDNVDDGYIATIETATRGGGLVILGTYEETGNEANFFGNWDMVGDGIDTDFFGDNGQYVGAVIVTHKGTRGPFIDTTYEIPAGACTGGLGSFIWTRDATATGRLGVFAHNQNSDFVGPNTTWGMEYRVDIDAAGGYVDETCTIYPDVPGTWSWAGRTGTMSVATAPAPIQGDADRTVSNKPLTLK